LTDNTIGKKYKETPVGRIPDQWDCVRAKEIASLGAGGTPLTTVRDYWGGEVPWMRSGDLSKKRVFEVAGRITEKGLRESAAFLVPKHSVLIGLAGQGKTRGTVAINETELATNQSVAALMPRPSVADYEFLFYNLEMRYQELRKLSTGDGGRGGLNLTLLGNLHFALPPIEEQRKIAEILHAWDRAIELVGKHIAAKQRLKKALMQRLLTGRLRFPGFKNKWKRIRLEEFLKLNLRKVEKPTAEYKRLGVLSHGKGTFTTMVEDPEEVDMTHLYKVKSGDLVVSITFAWEGAIAIVGNDGNDALVSHRFPTFVFDRDKVIPDFFRYVMVSPRFFYDLRGVSPGGAGRNRVMSKKEFLTIWVNVPTLEEQEKIGRLLTTIDNDLSDSRRLHSSLQEQKRGLMQKLLTGEVRVRG
jgi:type I restriction enzyme, S subunit